MSAQSAPRPSARRTRERPAQAYPATESSRPMGSAARLERRRREQHFRRRRRDLLIDVLTAIVLMIFLLSLTPGLGVIALLEGPVVLALVAGAILDRRRRRHRT